jgi:hypothetical protein
LTVILGESLKWQAKRMSQIFKLIISPIIPSLGPLSE